MAAFPFPPPTPPRKRLGGTTWAVIAGIVFLLVLLAVIAMSVA